MISENKKSRNFANLSRILLYTISAKKQSVFKHFLIPILHNLICVTMKAGGRKFFNLRPPAIRQRVKSSHSSEPLVR